MDLVIRNARIRGHAELVDIAIARDRIAAVGPRVVATAGAELDAAGNLVCPGFVNLHLHADKSLPYDVVKKVMSTCTAASYGRISLAVLEKETPVALAGLNPA